MSTSIVRFIAPLLAAVVCASDPSLAYADEPSPMPDTPPTTPAPWGGDATVAPIAITPLPLAPSQTTPPAYPYGRTEQDTAADEARRPGPGRVPVQFVSRSEIVAIGVPLFETVNMGPNGYAGTDIYGRRICSTPCTAYLPIGRFRLTINDAESGGAYGEIDVTRHGAHVELRATSMSRRGFGIATVIVGAVTTGVGAFFLATTAAGFGIVTPAQDGWVLGGTLLGAGLVGLATGIALIVTSRPMVLSTRALDRLPAVSFGLGHDAASATVTLRF